MNATAQFAKMLALMPVVALAAACGNSASPGAASSLPTSVAATDSGDASATSLVPACTVTSVSLRTDDRSDRTMIWVQAAYLPWQPTLAKCPAPRWTADRKGIVVDSGNPFRAGYPRTLTGIVNVTATAPNGIQNTIRVDLGGGSDLAAPQSNEACRRIDDISLRVVPTSGINVRIQAVYSYNRPPTTTNVCTVVPSWTASRGGLTADGFFATIGREPLVRTTVTATAPNGVTRSLTF